MTASPWCFGGSRKRTLSSVGRNSTIARIWDLPMRFAASRAVMAIDQDPTPGFLVHQNGLTGIEVGHIAPDATVTPGDVLRAARGLRSRAPR